MMTLSGKKPGHRAEAGTPGLAAGLRRRTALAGLACLLALAAGCDDVETTVTPNGSRLELPDDEEPIEFELDTVRIETGDTTYTLRVEVAETDPQRQRGLMFRTSMPEDAGMIFIYPSEREGGFWMYHTLIPLSIAYSNAAGEIVQIRDMAPCESVYASLCPTYPASVPFQYALEANRGYFEEHGIEPGDRIVVDR